MTDARAYPDRPFLAVSAAVIRDGRVLIVRRANKPAQGLYTLPGGVVEAGETLDEAIRRELREETSLEVEPVAQVGKIEAIKRDKEGRVAGHFVILTFAARWLAGEPKLSEELTDARWLRPSELSGLPTTDGLAGIVADAFAAIERAG